MWDTTCINHYTSLMSRELKSAHQSIQEKRSLQDEIMFNVLEGTKPTYLALIQINTFTHGKLPLLAKLVILLLAIQGILDRGVGWCIPVPN
jgi:hypothetical protein